MKVEQEELPQRPPRKNDDLRRKSTAMIFSASLDDRSSGDTEPPPMASRNRRQSAPEIFSKLTLPGKKGKSQKRSFFDFFRKRNERRNSTTEVSQTPVASPNGFVSSKVAPSGKLRRFSLQEITLTVPRIRSTNSDIDNLDVPKLFSRTECLTLATPLARTMPRSSRNTSHPDHFAEAFHGRLMPAESLPCLVPSIEKQRNSFFHEDDKVSESWHSPTMKHKYASTKRESLTSRIGESLPARRSGLQNLNRSVSPNQFEKIQEELSSSSKSNKSVTDNVANGSCKRLSHMTNESVTGNLSNGSCRRPPHINNESVTFGRPPLITYPSCEDDTKPHSQEPCADISNIFSSSNRSYQILNGGHILKSSLRSSRSTERINSLFPESTRHLGPDWSASSLPGSHRRSVSFDDSQNNSFRQQHSSSIIAYSESSSEESLNDPLSHFRQTFDEASLDGSTKNFLGFKETTEANLSKCIQNQQSNNVHVFEETTVESNHSNYMQTQSDHASLQSDTLVGASFDAVLLEDSTRSLYQFEETSAEVDSSLTDFVQSQQSDDTYAPIQSPFPIPKSLNNFQFDFLKLTEDDEGIF